MLYRHLELCRFCLFIMIFFLIFNLGFSFLCCRLHTPTEWTVRDLPHIASVQSDCTRPYCLYYQGYVSLEMFTTFLIYKSLISTYLKNIHFFPAKTKVTTWKAYLNVGVLLLQDMRGITWKLWYSSRWSTLFHSSPSR